MATLGQGIKPYLTWLDATSISLRCFGDRPISTQYCRGNCIATDSGWIRVDEDEANNKFESDDKSISAIEELEEHDKLDISYEKKFADKQVNLTGRAEFLETSAAEGNHNSHSFVIITMTTLIKNILKFQNTV